MDVFVIPVGPDQYELYCEQSFARGTDRSACATGVIGRARQRFDDWLHTAEHWDDTPHSTSTGRLARLHDRVMAWVAERVAEQRLLWNLRRETTVTVVHPDDVSHDQMLAIIHGVLRKDLERHQYWVWVDGLLFLVTFVALGPLFLLIPGVANLPALYFGFRAVGHWYSRGGARHGLYEVTWASRPSPALTELRQASRLSAPAREARVSDVATRLGLLNLTSFYDRICKASL
jgi:hypothetical protein